MLPNWVWKDVLLASNRQFICFCRNFYKVSDGGVVDSELSIFPLQRDQFSTSEKRIWRKFSKLKEIGFVDGIPFHRELLECLGEMRSQGYISLWLSVKNSNYFDNYQWVCFKYLFWIQNFLEWIQFYVHLLLVIFSIIICYIFSSKFLERLLGSAIFYRVWFVY